jgi:hypothetical protein
MRFAHEEAKSCLDCLVAIKFINDTGAVHRVYVPLVARNR